jgi:hypothetical protein
MVHVQCTGRLARDREDGVQNKVLEFFLLSNDGSDPAIAELLGIKEEQSYGIMNPESEMDIEEYQTDPNRIKVLIENYLNRHKIKIT